MHAMSTADALPDAGESAPVPSDTGARRVAMIVNRQAGTVRSWDEAALTARLRAAADRLGHLAELVLADPADLHDHMERAFADPAIDLVVIGGGDGTASSAAAAAIRHGKPICVLPLGTFNLFARLSGFPPDLEAALARLGDGELVSIDAGRIGERWFVHHVSIGAHPRVIRLREEAGYTNRRGKMLAGIRAWAHAILDPPKLNLSIGADETTLRGAFASVLVTVNELAEQPAMAPLPRDPLGGRLAVYATRTMSPGRLILFTLMALAGRWRSNPFAAFAKARRVAIRSTRPSLHLAMDGEQVEMTVPFQVELVPAALTVLRLPAA